MKNGEEVNSTYMQSVIIYVCSGTMLTNEWAIGCSHCYAAELDDRRKEMFVYYDGKKEMKGGKLSFDSFKQKQKIVELVRHPSNTAGGNPYYRKIQGFDVMLFRLEKPLIINDSTTGFKREIWDGESSELDNQDLMCVGWGKFSETEDSMVLRKAILKPRVELEEVVAGERVGDRLHVTPNGKTQITMPGDSGCGCYVERNGIWYLASINAGGNSNNAFSMSVAHPEIRNWIRNVVSGKPSKPLSNTWERFKEEVIKSAPAAASWQPGRLDVFARSQDNRLIQKTYEGSWTQWQEPKLKSSAKIPTLIDAPATVSWGPNRIDCFVRGIDSRMYHLWYGNGWLDIESFDGIITSAPTAASWASGRLDVFALSQNGRLTHKFYDSGWKPWTELSGSSGIQNFKFVDAPAAVSWGPKRLDCFMRGVDSRMYHLWYDNGWGKLTVFDGIIASAPAVASQASGQLDVFARGLNNHLMHKRFDGKWHPWTDLGGQTADAPAAVSWEDKRLDCFVRGNDGLMYHDWSVGLVE